MELKGLIECHMVPRATCPTCGETIEIDRWNIVCGFKPEPDPKKTPIDADHLAEVGIRFTAICPKCSQKQSDLDIKRNTGVYMCLSMSEFYEFFNNHVVKFMVDFSQGFVNLPRKDSSPKSFQ